MQLWTTYCPKKISWEITTARNNGKAGDSSWMNNTDIISDSLALLKKSGIDGIRLVIYPEELSYDGKKFDWKPVETMLDLAKKHRLLVDLCIGPFQYPNYPGIYVPPKLLDHVFANGRCLDTTPELKEYAERFLEKQLERYGDDTRIRGFHFANEWPDKQKVQGKREVLTCVSEAFMHQSARYLIKHTHKPILLNTNIDAGDRRRLRSHLRPLATILGKQGRIGFDVYPSQETWKKAFFQKLQRLIEPYTWSYRKARKLFDPCQLFFCEVEAQPWGGGRSWYHYITHATDPKVNVIQYENTSLSQTMNRYIIPSQATEISLWGADFCLVAHELGITWPLKQIKEIKNSES